MLKQKLIGFIAWVIYRCISMTWRLQLIEPEDLRANLKNQKPYVLANWHGDELVLITQIGPNKIATLASTSKDGEIMNTIIHLVGGLSSRGSSTRGAVGGVIGLIKLVRDKKRNLSLSVDGPKGPRHVVKPGVFELARLLKGAPIYPAGVACDRAWHFPKSWNKMFLPKPFARVVIVWGEAFRFDIKEDPRSDELRVRFENALHHAHNEAAKKIAGPIAE